MLSFLDTCAVCLKKGYPLKSSANLIPRQVKEPGYEVGQVLARLFELETLTSNEPKNA